MMNLMDELAQCRVADLHREAEAGRRAALIRSSARRRRRRSLRSALTSLPPRATGQPREPAVSEPAVSEG